MIERQPLAGRLTLRLHDASGRVFAERHAQNLVTDGGRALVAQLFAGKLNGTVRVALLVGGGDAAPAVANTGLANEFDRVDVPDDQIRVDGAVVHISATLPERSATQALTEAGIGITVGSSPEVLYNRVTYDVINKAPNMQMTLIWQIDFGGGAS